MTAATRSVEQWPEITVALNQSPDRPDRDGERSGHGSFPGEATGPPPPTGNPLWAIPLGSLQEQRERPIFLPSRRRPRPAVTAAAPPKPAPPPAAAPPPPKEPPPLALVGAILSDPDRIAVFRNEQTKEFIRMRVGEGHGTWVLRELSRTEAVFESQRETVVLPMPRPAGEGR